MKYYLHDSSAFDDEKITQLFINFGYEGLGLFYTMLEKFAKQEKPINTLALKHQLKVGKKLNKCWDFMEEIGLISSRNDETFNEQLLKFSGKYQIEKEKNKERVKEWRERQKVTNNVTDYEQVSNAPKVKESKVKESKVNDISIVSAKPKKTVEERIEDFRQDCLNFIGKYPNETLKAFFNHWSELTPDGKKLKKETQKTWQTKNRLVTWFNNEGKFSRGYSAPPKQTSGDKTMSVLANFIAKVDNDSI